PTKPGRTTSGRTTSSRRTIGQTTSGRRTRTRQPTSSRNRQRSLRRSRHIETSRPVRRRLVLKAFLVAICVTAFVAVAIELGLTALVIAAVAVEVLVLPVATARRRSTRHVANKARVPGTVPKEIEYSFWEGHASRSTTGGAHVEPDVADSGGSHLLPVAEESRTVVIVHDREGQVVGRLEVFARSADVIEWLSQNHPCAEPTRSFHPPPRSNADARTRPSVSWRANEAIRDARDC